MHTIRPLASLTYVEIHELARAAADRGEDAHDANPFPDASHPKARHFNDCHAERYSELHGEAV